MRQPRVPGLIWGRHHPVALDVVLVLALVLGTLLPLLRFQDSTRVDVAISVLVWLPALARRRYPEIAFAATVVLVLGSWAAQGLDTTDLLPAYVALWLVLFAVADRCTTRRTVVATVVCEIGVLLTHFSAPLTAMTIAAAVLGHNLRTRRLYTASLENRAARLEREQDQQARVAVAEERARLAREVHDVVAHNISVMIALADGATYATSEPRAGAAIAQVAVTGRQALTEMSRLLGVLREDDGSPSRHPAPGVADLEILIGQARAAGLSIELLVRGTPTPLVATAELAVYRLVQEALTNTLKHARHARTAHVRLDWTGDELAIEVSDNGQPVRAGVPGHGITGMRERFGGWGGVVTAGPSGHGGWLVCAKLPLPDATWISGPLTGPLSGPRAGGPTAAGSTRV